MRTIPCISRRFLILLGTVALVQTGFQTAAFGGGMTIGDLGAHAEGRAGAFTAKADDMSAIEYNPAGLTSIGSTQIYLGNRFGYAVEEYKRATALDDGTPYEFDRVANEHPWQLLNPMIAVGSNFGLDNWAFAIGAYAPPGVATQKFPGDGGQRYMLVERDVKILYYNFSVAWKFRDLFGLGASLQWVDAASIKLSLIVDGNYGDVTNPVGGSADYLTTVTGADHFGFSGILGAWVKPLPFLQIALAGRIAPTAINAACKVKVENYTGELADPTMSGDDVDLTMTLPPTARLGLRYMHFSGEQERFDVEVDFVYEAWHVMDRYVLDGHGITGELLPNRSATINKIYINKYWNDTFSVRLGGDYNVLPERLTLRAGTFFESGAKEDAYAYVDFFASHRVGGNLGVSVKFFGFDISLSYSYIYEIPFSLSEEDGKIYQQTPSDDRDPSTAAVANAGEYNSHYHFGSVAVSYTF